MRRFRPGGFVGYEHMFRSSLNRVLDWAERALAPYEEPVGGDYGPLGGMDEEFGADEQLGRADEPLGELANHLAPSHPHRRALRWERERRPGSVPHPPAHCISPVVRRGRGARRRDGSTR
jgi:hypothetical protein